MALTIEEAAQRVRMKVVYFRTTMTKLNTSGRDLLTPAQANAREGYEACASNWAELMQGWQYDPYKPAAPMYCPTTGPTRTQEGRQPMGQQISRTELENVSGLLHELAEVYEGEDATPEEIRSVAGWLEAEVSRRDRAAQRRALKARARAKTTEDGVKPMSTGAPPPSAGTSRTP